MSDPSTKLTDTEIATHTYMAVEGPMFTVAELDAFNAGTSIAVHDNRCGEFVSRAGTPDVCANCLWIRPGPT